MDLTLQAGECILNMRAAGVIIHNNKLLVHRNINRGHYALIGGRIKAGEDSITAVKREVEEELGKEANNEGCIAIIENFFDAKGKKYHEILFVHKLEFVNDEDKLIEHTLDNIEGKDYLKYIWLDIDKIDEYEILPKVTKEILKVGKYPIHKVNIDYESI